MPSTFPGGGLALRGSRKRAQVTIELIVVIGIFLLIFASLVNLSFERLHFAQELGSTGEAKMTGELLATAINSAYSSGKGFVIFLDEDRLNFTRLNSSRIEGSSVILPLRIDTANREIVISKNTSRAGGGAWNATVPILPGNVTRLEPTSYPELTIRNNGSHVLIYARSAHIEVS